MSYRLVDSNALAAKYPEVNDMPCVYADLPNGLDSSYVSVRRKGKWINEHYGVGECSAQCNQCKIVTKGKAHVDGFGYDYTFYDFCPNCGADMREAENDKGKGYVMDLITRCKDCKYMDKYWMAGRCYCRVFDSPVSDGGYCWMGEPYPQESRYANSEVADEYAICCME